MRGVRGCRKVHEGVITYQRGCSVCNDTIQYNGSPDSPAAT